jgi:hypothetical protein
MRTLTRVASVPLILLAACSSAPSVTDAQRVWCGGHPLQVISAGDALEIPPSEWVVAKAQVEEGVIDDEAKSEVQSILRGIAEGITATGTPVPPPEADSDAANASIDPTRTSEPWPHGRPTRPTSGGELVSQLGRLASRSLEGTRPCTGAMAPHA